MHQSWDSCRKIVSIKTQVHQLSWCGIENQIRIDRKELEVKFLDAVIKCSRQRPIS